MLYGFLEFLGGLKNFVSKMFELSPNSLLKNFFQSQKLLGSMSEHLVNLAELFIVLAPNLADIERIFYFKTYFKMFKTFFLLKK